MGFEQFHPTVSLIFFSAVIAGALLFQHPVYLAVALVCAFVYSLWRCGRRGLWLRLLFLPMAVVFAFWYSGYTHFGVTVLRQNFVGNNMTLEALVYGLVLGLSAAAVCLWLACLYSVFTTDKMVYLFGRVSPRLSLFLAIALRMLPRIGQQARRIHTAQCGIGRGLRQGSLFRRLKNALRILSMLITWTIESLMSASAAMRCRGSALRGRTAYSIYRFDNRDRAFVIGMFFCITLCMMAMLLGRATAVYDPRILLPECDGMSLLFYFAYGAFCLMPFVMEVWTVWRYKTAAEKVG